MLRSSGNLNFPHGAISLCSRPAVGDRICSRISMLCVLWRLLCNISHIAYTAIDSQEALAQVTAMFEMSRLLPWKKKNVSLYLMYTVCLLIYVYCVRTTFSNIYRRITAVNSLRMAYCTVIGSVYCRKILVATLVLMQLYMFAAMCCFLLCFVTTALSLSILCSYKVVPFWNSVPHFYLPPRCVLSVVHTVIGMYKKCILLKKKKKKEAAIQYEWYTQHYCCL